MGLIFQTPRLNIRQYTEADAQQALVIYGDPEVMRFLGVAKTGPVQDIDAMRHGLSNRIAHYARHPGYGCWAAELRTSGVIVGSILLKDLDAQPIIEVGWHLARFAWGNGYATEGGHGAIEYGFEKMGLDEIGCVVNPDNDKSLAVARRLGLTHRGKHRAYEQDLEYFTATRGRWSFPTR
jgi:[ribosomal protein S5]-alanine N-acetyltransferase